MLLPLHDSDLKMLYLHTRNQMLEGAKARGEDGSLAVRFYGEARDRALLRLGRPTKRRIMEENKRQKFWTKLPDGCQTALYPNDCFD